MSKAEKLPTDEELSEEIQQFKNTIDRIVKDYREQLESLEDWKRRVDRIGPHVGVDPKSYKDVWPVFVKLATLEAVDKMCVAMGNPELSNEAVNILFPKDKD